jgi:hypothetical protein
MVSFLAGVRQPPIWFASDPSRVLKQAVGSSILGASKWAYGYFTERQRTQVKTEARKMAYDFFTNWEESSEVRKKAKATHDVLWRGVVRHRSKKILALPPSREECVQIAKELHLRSPTVEIKSDIPEPLENLTKAQELSNPIAKCSRLVPYERFKHTLQQSFTGTLEKILQSPRKERSYVVIGDYPLKSTNWVISHLLPIMKIHPPEAVLTPYEVRAYLRKHPEIKHVVFVDDAAYSGDQAASTLYQVESALSPAHSLHVCVPYRTRYAENRFANIGSNIVLSPGERMFSYREMSKLGFYKESDLPYSPDSRTGTWFAHKSADSVSTDQPSMKAAASGQEAVAPYKYDSYHWDPKRRQLERLHAESLEAPFSDVFLARSLRGSFLLSQSYLIRSKSDPSRTLIGSGTEVPFGGANGVSQFKLSESDIIMLQDGEGISSRFLYEDGRLKSLPLRFSSLEAQERRRNELMRKFFGHHHADELFVTVKPKW